MSQKCTVLIFLAAIIWACVMFSHSQQPEESLIYKRPSEPESSNKLEFSDQNSTRIPQQTNENVQILGEEKVSESIENITLIKGSVSSSSGVHNNVHTHSGSSEQQITKEHFKHNSINHQELIKSKEKVKVTVLGSNADENLKNENQLSQQEKMEGSFNQLNKDTNTTNNLEKKNNIKIELPNDIHNQPSNHFPENAEESIHERHRHNLQYGTPEFHQKVENNEFKQNEIYHDSFQRINVPSESHHREQMERRETFDDFVVDQKHRNQPAYHDNSFQHEFDAQNKMKHNIPREYELDDISAFPSRGLSPHNMEHFVSLVMIVPQGSKHCYFYNPIANFEVDYQVLRGGYLDIGLYVVDPTGQPVAIRSPSSDSQISISVPAHLQTLPYAICLDNRKASYADKHVFLSVDVNLNWENPNELEKKAIDSIRVRVLSDSRAQAANDEQIKNINKIMMQLDMIFMRLRRIEHMQQRSDNFDSVDTHLMESNLERVTGGSLFQMLLMLGVAILQIGLIRSLFDQQSYFFKLWFGKRIQNYEARC